MTEKEFYRQLGQKRASRLNQIITAVNQKIPKQEMDLHDECEKQFYDNLISEAIKHKEKYGEWPIFEMMELESDDPVLDIYGSPTEC